MYTFFEAFAKGKKIKIINSYLFSLSFRFDDVSLSHKGSFSLKFPRMYLYIKKEHWTYSTSINIHFSASSVITNFCRYVCVEIFR